MVVEILVGFVLQIISSFGYAGIFLLMLAESTVLPVPSELVLPFAGYLVSAGSFDLVGVIVAALLGSVAGSIISYYLGREIGREAIIRFGKLVFLEEKHLDLAHNWFSKYGEKTVLVCRFIPAVRHVISVPAGVAEMSLKKFIIYTAVGAFFWNLFLIAAGIALQKNWGLILNYTKILDLIVAIAAIALAAFFIYKHLARKKKIEAQKPKKQKQKWQS